MSDEINDKNDDGTNVADAVSPSGEIEVLDIKRADSSSGRNGGKGGRNGGRREYKPFPGWLYGVLFVVFDMAAVAALQWGVSQSGTRVQLSSPVVGWGFVSKMWTKGNFVFVLNLLHRRAVSGAAHAVQPVLDSHAGAAGRGHHRGRHRAFQGVHTL